MHSLLYPLVEVEQRQPSADAACWHTDGAGDTGQRGTCIKQVAVRSGFFDRAQVGTLQVFG